MNKLSILDQLIDALASLVALLALDPGCQWRRKFESDLAIGRHLKDGAVGTVDLAALSASVRHVYGGMGSFNDYAPVIYDAATRRYAPIPGTEDFDSIRGRVFDLALALIVVAP
ncbi:DUF6966 domain-containing protein [Paraburkholderia sediminicola]|uniref:DUF6966 domain-containing protein n=1 Tax=Paraburkholderia sediminicola TaxID=458836 RepID=UPI0038B993BC